jgi:hypothetical protein
MILGITGSAGSGKTTMANYIIKELGFIEIAFADPMKRFVQDLFAFSDDQIWGPSDSRNAPDIRYHMADGNLLSPRLALQTLGTEWGRNCYPKVWVDYALRTAKTLLDVNNIRNGYLRYDKKVGFVRSDVFKLPTGVVMSDLRFGNEIEGVHKAGGKVVRLKREGYTGNVGIKGHASEEEQKSISDKDIDFVLNVPEGIPLFEAEISKFIKSLKR